MGGKAGVSDSVNTGREAGGRTLKLTVAYDGTDFHGFQAQAGSRLRTVQETLESAWERLTGERVRMTGAGRTDAGVHALGQVVGFVTASVSIPEARVPYAMNSVLPDDVRVTACERAPQGFHARFDAIAKTYAYRIDNQPFPSPLLRRYAHFVAVPLDLAAMQAGACHLVGRHDFAAFAGAGGPPRRTVRHVMRCTVTGEPGGLVVVEVEADGFLYHMVRSIVGTLLVVGRGERPPQWVRDVLESRDRSQAGPTAPAKGLVLVSVRYDGGRPGA